MLTRVDLIRLFGEFTMEHHLTITNLLDVADMAVRECASRCTDYTEEARHVVEILDTMKRGDDNE